MDLIDSLLDTAAPLPVPRNGARLSLAPALSPKPAPVALDRDKAEWVDSDAAARITADIATARAAGFGTGVPVYRVGTVVNSTGVANFNAKRAEFDALPLATVALASLQGTIVAEQRKDVTVSLADLRMDSEGAIGLASKGQTLWTCERDMLATLASRVSSAHPEATRPAGLGSYLASCPKRLRAPNLNAWTETAPEEATAVLRTRVGKGGDRGVFAVVSDAHPTTGTDIDKIAAMTSDAIKSAGLGADMRARVTYDGRRAMLDVQAFSNIKAESAAAGEIFRAGVRITTDDTGGGAIVGSATIEQNLCRNLIILHTGSAHTFRIVHKGDVRRIVEELRHGIRKALQAASVFARQWSTACGSSVLDLVDFPVTGERAIAEVMAATFAGALSGDVLPIGSGTVGGRVRTEVPRLLQAWKADRAEGSAAVAQHGGATLAAVVNAATRYAHTVEADEWEGDRIERAAGKVLAGAESIELPSVDDFLSWNTTAAELVKESRILRG